MLEVETVDTLGWKSSGNAEDDVPGEIRGLVLRIEVPHIEREVKPF